MPLIFEIECGPEIHRIEIRNGKAHMLDHNETTIEAFTAFGAEEPECLHWVRRWPWMWFDLLVKAGFVPDILRSGEHYIRINSKHLPPNDRMMLGVLKGDPDVFSFPPGAGPGGIIVYAYPGPKHMRSERSTWVEEHDLSEEMLNILELAGNHGVAYVLFDDEGFTVPGLPLFKTKPPIKP
jgi:hypothetical protein